MRAGGAGYSRCFIKETMWCIIVHVFCLFELKEHYVFTDYTLLRITEGVREGGQCGKEEVRT